MVRYAAAKKISISLFEKDNYLHLFIRDDGKGFDQNFATGKKTLGLLGIKERVSIMKGNFKLNTAIGKGTTIQIIIPLEK